MLKTFLLTSSNGKRGCQAGLANFIRESFMHLEVELRSIQRTVRDSRRFVWLIGAFAATWLPWGRRITAEGAVVGDHTTYRAQRDWASRNQDPSGPAGT
jgi:hypothetical protein